MRLRERKSQVQGQAQLEQPAMGKKKSLVGKADARLHHRSKVDYITMLLLQVDPQ